jgi:hypothetical protein
MPGFPPAPASARTAGPAYPATRPPGWRCASGTGRDLDSAGTAGCCLGAHRGRSRQRGVLHADGRGLADAPPLDRVRPPGGPWAACVHHRWPGAHRLPSSPERPASPGFRRHHLAVLFFGHSAHRLAEMPNEPADGANALPLKQQRPRRTRRKQSAGRGRNAEKQRSMGTVAVRRSAPDVRLQAPRVTHRAAAHDHELPIRLFNREPGVELVIVRRLVADHLRGVPRSLRRPWSGIPLGLASCAPSHVPAADSRWPARTWCRC